MSKRKGGAEDNHVINQDTRTDHEKEDATCLKYLYNPRKGTILDRNRSQWVKLLIFYSIFYLVLASLFTICMQGLFASLSTQYPTWQLEESLIGTNPGLGFRPISNQTERGALISYRPANKSEVNYWVNFIDEFLIPYNNRSALGSAGRNQVICSFDQPPGPGQVCALEFSAIEYCNTQNKYGYQSASPCIFLKLNRIYNWVPEYYDDINELPDEMPEQLKSYIKSLAAEERKQIWVSCGGQFPGDEEVIGEVKYYPSQGFPGFFYPYRNQPGYLSPLVAVHFQNVVKHRILNIECRAWAKNIEYVRSINDRQGSTMFEILVD